MSQCVCQIERYLDKLCKKRKKANKDAVDDQRREMTETNGRKMTVKTKGRKVMEIKGRGRMMII